MLLLTSAVSILLKSFAIVLHFKLIRYCRLTQFWIHLQITWLKNGFHLQSSSSRMAILYDGEYCVLRFRRVMQEDSGNYTVLAENAIGQQSTSATLTVDPSFHRAPDRRSVQDCFAMLKFSHNKLIYFQFFSTEPSGTISSTSPISVTSFDTSSRLGIKSRRFEPTIYH